MKSSSGAHFVALDHVRALAALMVVTWHFIHGAEGHPVSFDYVPNVFVLSILDEGHTGVALFMTLSGYLFAKLLQGKSIRFSAFVWNRALRLVPLLAAIIIATGVRKLLSDDGSFTAYAQSIAQGLVLPTLPNGGWSITVEFHYYLLLPLLLWAFRKSHTLAFAVILAALTLRLFIYRATGEVQTAAYWTIIGRIDQFILGMLALRFREQIAGKPGMVGCVLMAFALFYWYFDMTGGYHHSATSWLWIIIPTIEGLAYGTGIAWYETKFPGSNSRTSTFIARLGEYSYSIYLLHFFFVFRASELVSRYFAGATNFYVACACAFIFFLLMMPLGYLSYRFVESPFLKLRRQYVIRPTFAVVEPAAVPGP